MSGRYIVPVGPADGRGEAVVIEVLREGSHPLDVRLVGCEGENPYVASIRHRNLADLRLKFKGTDDEWAVILSHFLLMKQPDQEHAHLLRGVCMVYTLKNRTLALSFRQAVHTIKVTLGEILLPQDDGFELNPFDWAQASAMAHAQTLQQMAELKARLSSEQHMTATLNAQLDDFIKTKNEAEIVMLQHFMVLLNEKKRKIRDLDRLLASAKTNQSTPTAARSTRGEIVTRKAGASRTSKRKALSQAAEPRPVVDAESESSSDQMEMDQAKAEERDEEERPEPVTPELSEDETDEEGGSAPQARARSSETPGPTSAATHSLATEGAATRGVPPPRVLPFNKRPTTTRGKTRAKKHLGATGDDNDNDSDSDDSDDSDDETDDEEL